MPPLAALRRFVRARAVPVEQCELCGAGLNSPHQHVLELAGRKLMCACDACAILFSDTGSGRYRRVPHIVRFLPDFRLSDQQWDALYLPINLAFFFRSSTSGRVVAMYPSPAGPTESLLAIEAWSEMSRENPLLSELAPDVEALLVNRIGPTREYYRVSIDECYKLTGLIRTGWRGLSGGKEIWNQIDEFFAGLKKPGASHGGHHYA